MVKSGGKFSEPHEMPGGAPQGTCSGNYLFSATIDGIEMEEFATIYSPGSGTGDDRGQTRPASPEPALDDGNPGLTQGEIERILGIPSGEKAWTVKYVDDFTATQRLAIDTGISYITTGKEEREIHAGELQKVFDRVRFNAGLIGMVVHPDKTKLLCISASSAYSLSTFIYHEGRKMSSSDELKVLGAILSSRPNQWANVWHIRRKFAAKLWSSKRLKRVQLPEVTLTKVYSSYLRPILEYASPSYHSLMTSEQLETVERCQRTALKTIYGYKASYDRCLRMAKIERLSERGATLQRNFALKAYTNPRFSDDWFLVRERVDYTLRRRNAIKERRTGSERLRRSPIDSMRRILNNEEELPDQPTGPGRTSGTNGATTGTTTYIGTFSRNPHKGQSSAVN